MTHNTHLVKGRLPIEQHNVVIGKVALDDPPVRQEQFALVANVAQINPGAIGPNDVLRSRMLRGAVRHQLGEVCMIERSDPDRHGQIHRHAPGHTHLMDPQIGIGGNDRPSRKIDSFPHEIATQSTFLGLQPLRNGFEWATAALCDLRHPANLIVHERSNVVLECEFELFHHHGRFATGNGLLQTEIRFDNVHQLVRQIVFGTLRSTSNRHGRSHVQRWDGQHLYEQPIGPSVRNIQSEQLLIFIADLLKDFYARFTRQELLRIAAGGVGIFGEFRTDMQIDFGVFGLDAGAMFALFLVAQQFVQGIQAAFAGFDLCTLLKFVFIRQHPQPTAMVTHTPEHFEGGVEEPQMIDWFGQFQMTKIPRTRFVLDAP